MDKKKQRKIILLVILAVIVIIAVAVVMRKYMPTKETMDLTEYYGLQDAMDVAVVVDGEISEEIGIYKDGQVYLPYDVAHSVNERLFLDQDEKILLFTDSEGVCTAKEGEDIVTKGNDKSAYKYIPLMENDGRFYVAADYVKDKCNMEYSYYDDPDRIVINSQMENEVTTAKVKENTPIRLKGGIKSPILTNVQYGQTVMVLEEGDNWHKVMSEDGIIGYIWAKSLDADRQMVGYYGEENEYDRFGIKLDSYKHVFMDETVCLGWNNVTNTVANGQIGGLLANASEVNVVSPTWFRMTDNEGNISNIATYQYVADCHAKGIKVWPTVNNFDNEGVEAEEVLTSTKKREFLEDNILNAATAAGVDGVNIDFERLNGEETGDSFIQFVREFSLKAHEKGLCVSVDNYVSSAYTSYYNRREQAAFADYVIIMAYDEHYAGSDEGSVSSYGYVETAVNGCIEEKVPQSQIVLGLPFYTRVWQEVPKQTSGDEASSAAEDYVPYNLSSASASMTESWKKVNEVGAVTTWDDETGQYYAEWTSGENTFKVWLEDPKSLEKKLTLMSDNKLACGLCILEAWI